MARSTCERWAFVTDWLDPSSGVKWMYQLFAYLVPDGPVEVEMFDIKNKRHFLKRVKCESVQPGQLYVGSTITVFARQLHIVSYGDEATSRAVEARSQRTLALILPDVIQHTGKIMNAIYNSGFSIINLRMCQMDASQATQFLAAQECSRCDPGLVSLLTSGPVVAMELMAASCIRKWLDILGPEDVTSAKQQAHNSIRGLFAKDSVHLAALGSDSPSSAACQLDLFFGSIATTGRSITGSCRLEGSTSPSCHAAAQVQSCCRCSGTSLGVILPHAVKDGIAGLMLEEVQTSFQVTALQLFNLTKPAAAEFLEVYKGVVPPGEFSSMVDELVSGPCIAIEVMPLDGSEPVETFRQLVGPRDPELARVLRPHTLRARFGVSRVRNSIHCTDLVEDGPLEASYFFSVLQQPVLAT